MGDALGVAETSDAIALDFTLEKIFKTNKPANFYLLKDKKSGKVAFSLGTLLLLSDFFFFLVYGLKSIILVFLMFQIKVVY